MSNINQQLLAYVQNALNKGYSLEQIKIYLLQNNVNAREIEEAVEFFEHKNSRMTLPKGHPGKYYALIIAIILIVGAAYYFYNNYKPSEPLTITAVFDKQNYYTGDQVNIQLSFNKEAGTLAYTVRGTQLSDSTTINSIAGSINIVLPDNMQNGIYYVDITVDNAKSTQSFYIISNPGQQNTTHSSTNNSTTIIPTVNNTSVPNYNYQEPKPIIYSSHRTFNDDLSTIKLQVKNNPNAINNCKAFTASAQKDICYGQIAGIVNKYQYCEYVVDTSIRDGCYIGFVIKGNSDICDKILDASSKEYCNQVKIVSLMQLYYQQNKTSEIVKLNDQFKPSIYNSIPQIPSYTGVLSSASTLSLMDITTNATNITNSSG